MLQNNSFWVTCGHFTLTVFQETSGGLKSPTTNVSNLLDVLQISFILDSNMLFIGAVKLGHLYMQAIQNCPILLSSSIANESGAHSAKSFPIFVLISFLQYIIEPPPEL